MRTVLSRREYRLLWLGQSVSHLGDQFHLVALPWLVLVVTGDPLQLGLVLAAAGVPRAVLMLFGGALADRLSPRTLMLVSNLVRFAITALLVVAVAGGAVQLWMIYGVAASFGVVSGFFLPAAEASLPRVLPGAELAAGNSLLMIADQVAQFVGPALAGSIVALLSGAAAGNTGRSGLTGIAVAFAVDGATFAFAALMLALMRPLAGLGSEKHPLHDVAEGLRYAWHHTTTRTMVIVIALANFLLTGPLLVGLPVLASTRFAEGAAAFGMILSGYALGNLIGLGLAGATTPSARVIGVLGTAIFPFLAVIYGALGVVGSTWVAVALMVVGGVGNGYLSITIISLLQRMTPPHLVGRVMALLMLSMYGLGPLSQVIAGAVLQASASWLFLGAAVGLLVPGALAFRHRDMWDFTPAPGPAEVPRTAPDPVA
jgi:MFS family permease